MLITQSPQSFKGGGIWKVVTGINGSLKAIGYALLVLFFLVGVVKTYGSFAEMESFDELMAKKGYFYNLFNTALWRVCSTGTRE